MQICRSYEVLCGDPKFEHLVRFGNPMFLLCVLGMCQSSFRITPTELGLQVRTLWSAGQSNASMLR